MQEKTFSLTFFSMIILAECLLANSKRLFLEAPFSCVEEVNEIGV